MARKGFNIASLRNLPQYRDLTDEEFEEKIPGLLHEEAETLAQEYFEQFQEDYVLDDLKANDKIAVEILCYLYAQVRYNQDRIHTLQGEESDYKDTRKGLSSLVTDNEKLIKSITTLENQLSISRTARLKEEGTNLVDLVATVRDKARDFLEKKLHYIYCSKCDMLLGNVWALYQDFDDAFEVHFTCKREQKGKVCNTEVIIRPEDLNDTTSQAIRRRDGVV